MYISNTQSTNKIKSPVNSQSLRVRNPQRDNRRAVVRCFRLIRKHTSALCQRDKDHILWLLLCRNQLITARRISSAQQGCILADHLPATSAHPDPACRVGIVVAYHFRLVKRLDGLADIPDSGNHYRRRCGTINETYLCFKREKALRYQRLSQGF